MFSRGNATSGAPICSGIIQLARPTKAGITPPKIITSACMVVPKASGSPAAAARSQKPRRRSGSADPTRPAAVTQAPISVADASFMAWRSELRYPPVTGRA